MHARVDRSTVPATLAFPEAYNAAADLVMRHRATARGAHPAYVHEDGTTTYAELAELVCQAANWLDRRGVQPGDRVLVVLPDTLAFPVWFLGSILHGAVPIALNTLLPASDYATILTDAEPALVLTDAALHSRVGAALTTQHAPPPVVVMDAAESLGQPLGAWLDGLPTRRDPYPAHPEDIAFWLYSSGSTGAPKGVRHRHSSLVRTAVLYAEGILGMRPDDVVLSAAKLFFAYGLGNALTFPLWVGATALLLRGRPTPDVLLDLMTRHPPTLFFGAPTGYAAMLGHLGLGDGPALSRLRLAISAGEALPADLARRWQTATNTEILDGLGSTELLHIVVSNRPGDVRPGSSGRPVPGYDVQVRGPDGAEVEPDTFGELWVRGSTAATDYWRRPERSEATFVDGWVKTGDQYRRHDDGTLTYGGRVDDMLKVSGIWVSPFDVESALIAHPAVREAAVVARRDAHELVKPEAWVVLEPGQRGDDELEAALQAWVKSRMAPHAYPRWVRFTDELPKTATGKIRRFALRDRSGAP